MFYRAYTIISGTSTGMDNADEIMELAWSPVLD